MNATIDEKTHRVIGTRTSVYLVMDYYVEKRPADEIARELRLTIDQVRDAIDFIEANKELVRANYQKMLDRCAQGNPPEVEAKLVKTREKMRKFLEERRALAQNSV